MGKCDYCGSEEVPIHTCNHCERTYCSSHRLPEKHDCPLHVPQSEAHFESAGPDTNESGSTASESESESTPKTDHRPPPPSDESTHTPPRRTKKDTDDLSPREKQLQAQECREREPSADDTRPPSGGSIHRHVKPLSTFLGGLAGTIRFYLTKLISLRLWVVAVVMLVAISGTVGTGITAIDSPSSDAVEIGSGVLSGTTAWLNQLNSSESGSEEGDQTADPVTEGEFETSGPLNETTLKMAIHNEVNEVRETRDLKRLEYSQDLESIAERHSTDMATSGYFSHTSPDGVSMSDRYDSANIDCLGAENIWRGTSTFGNESDIAKRVVNSWMDSPGHRENILDQHRAEGIGIAIGEYEGDENIFVTQNFCQR